MTPNFMHYNRNPSKFTIHLASLIPPPMVPPQIHPTNMAPCHPPACPAITRLLTTSAGVAQIEATKPLQQALKVWTAVPCGSAW